MRKFRYAKPDSIETASAILCEENSNNMISAGGTDLLGVLREKIQPEYVDTVVSLKGISGLSYIKESADGISIGAMTKLSEIVDNPSIKSEHPLLAQAAHSVASPQIRNMATVGGNICQENRCWYYRYPDNKFDCMRKGGDLCNAMSGNNKYHSIFGSFKVCDTPCKKECPNGTDIPEYFDLIRQGKHTEAARVLLSVNPLAAATGRICPHTCEEGCNRKEFEEKVSIRDIERFTGDYILDHDEEVVGPLPQGTGKKVAIVGAGPSGLTSAFYLSKAGHSITVFDDNDRPGGMLTYGIPAYRLPEEIVEKTVKMLGRMGVEFRQNQKLGKDITMADLQNDYDAVFLGIGAWSSVKIGCLGEDAKGVLSGIDFLFRAANKTETGIGESVAVVGGGNTAMDACRTAVRLGAKKVYNLYRRTQHEMPADEEEIVEGRKEGVEFKYLVAPVQIITHADGRVCQVILQKMELGEPDESGRRKPVPIEGETETVNVDTVIAAIGQGIDSAGLSGVELNKKGEIIVGDTSFATNLSKVFAAGDAVIGPKTAIEAIASARKAADAINMYLGVSPAQKELATRQRLTFDPACTRESERLRLRTKPVAERNAYEEDAASADISEILKEANRCFNCGCVAGSPSDMAPAIIALNGVIVTTKREIPGSEFFKAGVCSSTVLDKGEIVTEIRIPKPAAGSIQFYNKFRYRKSIDFPVLGLAANFALSDGIFSNVKLVASSVCPVPLELTEVERFLVGKAPSQTLAEEAAELAVRDALPLAENRHKITIMKALVRRAIADNF
jgi:NADPH-dependent glutamate synthase beta subunit-like oxidoreductase/CO/xanthine dehydrogenase FAD-binding subunit